MTNVYPDRYSRLSSPIHRVPVSTKLPILLLFSIIVMASPMMPFSVAGLLGIALLIVAIMSRIPLRYLAQRLLRLELFVIGIAGLMLLRPDGGMVFLRLAARSTLCLVAVLLFSTTTQFTDILTLLRRWRLPPLLITLLALTFRYLFVLTDELGKMDRARLSRTFSRRVAWRSRATVIAQLFVRTTERAERVYAAMCARGWR